MTRAFWLVCSISLLAAFTGCGPSGPKLYPLTGKVLFNGTPLSPKAGETAFVEFFADKTSGNVSKHLPRGDIGTDGSYMVTTTNRPGLEEGAWVARIVYQKAGGDGSEKTRYAPPLSLIATKYSDFGSSGFKVTAGADQPTAPEFAVSKTP